MKFNIITFGCKVNTYESEFMKEELLLHDFKYVNDYKTADLVIVNTCSVTNTADNKGMKTIRDIRRDNKDCILVVCGCMAENKRELLNDLNIDILFGNKDKEKIYDLVTDFSKTHNKYINFYETRKQEFVDMEVKQFDDQTRAYVKIQDGCNNFCSFCIIPSVRGSIRSKDINKAVEEVKELVASGHKEIVFTGISTGMYGKETGKYNLTTLIKEVSKIKDLQRIRLSSIYINELDEEFLNELKTNPKLCGHLHISLQSGSDKILKAMHRHYNTKEFLEGVQKLREARPTVNLTTDVITGFPGETEEDFEDTINFCKEVGFSKIHTFPYSKRAGTLAETLPDQIDQSVKKDRARRLIKVSDDLGLIYNQKFVGEEIDVLIEEIKDGFSIGHTENYLKVKINKELTPNTNYKAKITKAHAEYVDAI